LNKCTIVRQALVCLAILVLLAGSALAGATVAIVKGKDVDRMVAEAIDLLGGMRQFVKDGQKVTLKPNLVHQPALPGREQTRTDSKVVPGFTTDIRIVKALAQQMLKAAQCKVAVAEGTPNDATKMFDFLGYTQMARQAGIQLVDLDRSVRTKVKIDGPARKEYSLPVATQTCDVLVDVPVMKTHQLAGVTLGMKNLFGLLPEPRKVFHARLDEVLCDLCAARKPDLVIVDGLVAMEGQGPLEGTPVPMGLLVAGTDVVAVDTVCAAIMGFEPSRVTHLALAAKRGLGEADLSRITVKGLSVKEVLRPFKHALWEAEVSIPKTDEAAQELLPIADTVRRTDWNGELFYSFGPRHLKVDSQKYPGRESQGFTVRIPIQGNRIYFYPRYRVLYPEEAQAAMDEVAQWIGEKLGKNIPMQRKAMRAPE